jgi:hypothetical protein
MRLAVKVLAGIVAFALLVPAFVLVFPSTALNTKTLAFALRRFGRDERPSWSELSLVVHSKNLLTKRIVLSARDLCVDEKNGAIKGCLRALELDATFRLGAHPFFSVLRLERLEAKAEPVRVDTTAFPAPAKKKRSKGGFAIPAYARGMTFGSVDLSMPRAVVLTSSGTTIAGITASLRSSSPAPLTADVYAILEGVGAASAKRFDAHVAVSSVEFRDDRLASLDAMIRARGAGLTADASATVRPLDGGRLKLEARANVEHAGRAFTAKGEGEGDRSGGWAAFDASVVDPRGKLRRVALERCRIEADLSKKSGHLERADLDCRVSLTPAPFGKGLKLRNLTGTLTVRGKTGARSGRERFETRVETRLGSAKDYGGFTLELDADLSGPAGGSPIEERRVRAKASVGSFAGVVRFLAGTKYDVPAPLNALDGTLSASADLQAAAEGERQAVEFQARTDLASEKQAVVLEVKGTAVLPNSEAVPRLEADVELKRVALQLPYLELKGAPSPVPDRRFKTGDPKRDAAVDALRQGSASRKAPAVDYDLNVRTGSPIVLRSNLIKSPIPVSLRLRARPEGLSGTFSIEAFDMEVFRQNARIDHITLTPAPKGAATALDGKIIYKRNGVTVDILLLGTTAKPTVVFESSPPMSRNEIVALVLYGKMPDELDVDQKASAGNASAAMTNGAFGLASLYLFASTPVDSVGYDAATQSYRVRFKLPGGATLAVGSDLQESRTLSLTKRLSRHWQLQTEAGSGSRDRNQVTTFLQWFERY